jgi:putative aldouronate transport system permease protein
VTNIWKGAGWGSIVYLAAISNISPEIYEAATMDGANRFQKLFHITWPGIKSTAVVLLILAVGGVMNGGFDQIFNLSNSVVQDATEIIDTYIYRITFGATMVNYGYSTAVGLFKGVINFTLLFTANKIANMLGERGIF